MESFLESFLTNTRQKFILDIREQYLYKNPDVIAKDFATEIGVKEADVCVIKNVEDLKKIVDFAKKNKTGNTGD